MTLVVPTTVATPKLSTEAKLKVLRKVFFAYTLIISLVLFLALLRLAWPSVMNKILREDVGVVAFVCFVSIQGSLELEDKEKVREDDSDFKVKFAVYVLDLCLCINGRVRPAIVVFGCAFSLLQLALVYWRVASTREVKKNGQSSGMVLISANVLALAFVIGKEFLPSKLALDFVKLVLIGGVIMFYVNIILVEKLDSFMQKSIEEGGENILFIGFKIIKPLVKAILGKLKKLNRVKAK